MRRTVKIKVTGLRLNSFINSLRNSGIVCSYQRCSAGEYSAVIYLGDLKRTEEIAEQHNAKIYSEDIHNGTYAVMKYRARYGIAVGILLTALCIFFTSAFIMKIEVNGCSSISEEAVLDIIEEAGISHGKFIPKIDFTAAEYYLKSEISRISWAAIRSRGGRVIVDISEDNLLAGSVQSEIPCNIISDRDALIVSVSPYRGQCRIKPGDMVETGEILISGIITNESNNYVIERAQGEIIGEYRMNQKFTEYFECTEKEYIKTKTGKILDFFGFRIPLTAGRIRENYDKSETKEMLSLFGCEIPAGIITEKYEIYERNTILRSREETENKLNLMVYNYLKNFLSETEITDFRKDEKVFEDRIEYDVSCTVRGKIGKEKMIFPGKGGEDQ